jgi:nucleoporin POM152
LELRTLISSAMDVGVTAAFDFTGTPPFVVEYTEQRDRQRATKRSAKFKDRHGEITLQPEHEGHYTYVSSSATIWFQ